MVIEGQNKNEYINQIVTDCYKNVVSESLYDYDKSQNHNKKMFDEKVIAKDLPKIEEEFVEINHVGCGLHFGMDLFKKLRDNDIESYIAITNEENDKIHVSVCYSEDNKFYIADPVEDIKLNIKDVSTKKIVRNCNIKYLKIPIGIFIDKQTENDDFEKNIKIFDPYDEKMGEKEFFNDFLINPKKIYYKDKNGMIGVRDKNDFVDLSESINEKERTINWDEFSSLDDEIDSLDEYNRDLDKRIDEMCRSVVEKELKNFRKLKKINEEKKKRIKNLEIELKNFDK